MNFKNINLLEQTESGYKIVKIGIQFWFFTSKPKEDTLYSLFSVVDLIGRKIPQYINAHPYILEGTYSKEVDIIREVNLSNIDVSRVLTT